MGDDSDFMKDTNKHVTTFAEKEEQKGERLNCIGPGGVVDGLLSRTSVHLGICRANTYSLTPEREKYERYCRLL